MVHAKLIVNSTEISSESSTEVNSIVDNSVVGSFVNATTDQIEDIFEYATNSQKIWSTLPQKNRTELFRKIAIELHLKKDVIADLLAHEIAKPFKSCLDEIERSVEYINLVCDTISTISGESLSGDYSSVYKKFQKTGLVEFIPVGVVLCISPFNYPINLSISKIIPALISGNTVVFKPASNGVLAAFLMSQIFNSILPAGVFQFVSGKSSEIGDLLVKNPNCNFVNFTGSTSVGRNIAKILNEDVNEGFVKGLILEMGGKDSAIITANADLKKVVSETMKGAFSYNGQRCTAVKRVFVHSSLAENYISKMKVEISKLIVGDPFTENVNITTLISKNSADYVEELVKDAQASGLKTEFEFKRESNFIFPNIIVIANTYDSTAYKNIRILNEEQFGPILPIVVYDNVSKIIEYIEQGTYGLENCVFSEDLNEAFDISRKLTSGTVQINGKSDRGPDNFPFSGFKNSGFGVQGVRDSILSMMKKKLTVLNF